MDFKAYSTNSGWLAADTTDANVDLTWIHIFQFEHDSFIVQSLCSRASALHTHTNLTFHLMNKILCLVKVQAQIQINTIAFLFFRCIRANVGVWCFIVVE